MEPLDLTLYMIFLTESKSHKISGYRSFGMLGIVAVGKG